MFCLVLSCAKSYFVQPFLPGKSLDASHRMLERMSAILKRSPNTEDYKKTLVNFDWQKVCFDQYGPADCKKFWYSVHRQVKFALLFVNVSCLLYA